MNEKIVKEIVKELRLIRLELQKANVSPQPMEQEPQKEMTYDDIKARAGERVTF